MTKLVRARARNINVNYTEWQNNLLANRLKERGDGIKIGSMKQQRMSEKISKSDSHQSRDSQHGIMRYFQNSSLEKHCL